ncbi:LytR family transcriptional attenuator [Paenibacillus cellulosilyticus]|uniref:LytR family transcriptional attenuator n=1 Tax=Paenibacillus cellulosilyticus TaxID=375489 RepID=A0A2V2YPD9_9BACL|nr:LCP family protein [Paenibacillus cellulosilyticus]PWV98370.1 LytR family transcriptional attenuator [Paenibacillus cellulosilyticus]QKS43222.1 LCP family protein [Paenibacillus cellulosilyticus]
MGNNKGQLKRAKRKKRRGRPLLLVLGIVLVLAAGSGLLFKKQLALFAFHAFFENNIKSTLEDSYVPVDEADEQTEDQADEPFSLLLIGTDQRESEPARSDTLIFSVVRPKDNRMLLLSIPRDSYATIVGYKGDVKSKINSAYAHGGVSMTINTVENLLDQQIQYYATVNFKGLINIVDTLGGVELPITKDIVNKQKDHEKFTIEANKPIYSGEEALNYVRYREDSDFNRTARQREFIGQLFNRIKTFSNMTKIDDVIRIGGDNLQTNMKPDKIIDLAESTFKASPQITSYMLKGKDAMKSGIYYYILDEDDVKFANEVIGKWLNPDTNVMDLSIEEAS